MIAISNIDAKDVHVLLEGRSNYIMHFNGTLHHKDTSSQE